MALYTDTFIIDSQSKDSSITYMVSIGEHTSDGIPIPGESLSFGTIEKTIDLLPFDNNSLIVYPYVSSSINISKNINLENHAYIVNKLDLKLANAKIDSNEKYLNLSDIMSSHFVNKNNLRNKSIINAYVRVWIVSNSVKSISDCIPIYSGFVRDISYDKKSVVLSIEDSISKQLDINTPVGKMPSENNVNINGVNYGFEENLVGQVIPMVYGRHPRSKSIAFYNKDSELSSQDESIEGYYQSYYLINDRYGSLYPDSNISILSHSEEFGSDLDIISDSASLAEEIEYKATPLVYYGNSRYNNIVDVRNLNSGGVHVDEYSINTNNTQIELISKFKLTEDGDIDIFNPNSTFAQGLLYYYYAPDILNSTLITPIVNETWESGVNAILLPITIAIVAITLPQLIQGVNTGNLFGAFSLDYFYGDPTYPIGVGVLEQVPFSTTFECNNEIQENILLDETNVYLLNHQSCLASNFAGSTYSSIRRGGLLNLEPLDNSETWEFDDIVHVAYVDHGFQNITEELELLPNQITGDNESYLSIGGTRTAVSAAIITDNGSIGTNEQNILKSEGYPNFGDNLGFYEGTDYYFPEDEGEHLIKFSINPQENAPFLKQKFNLMYSPDEPILANNLAVTLVPYEISQGIYSFQGKKDQVLNYQVYNTIMAYLFGKYDIINELRINTLGRTSGSLDVGEAISTGNSSSTVLLEGQNEVLDNPISIIIHILEKELGHQFLDLNTSIFDAFNFMSESSPIGEVLNHEDKAWRYALNITQEQKAKSLIEDICKNTPLFPMYITNKQGNLDIEFAKVKSNYDNEEGLDVDLVINSSEVISYKASKTKANKIISRVKVKYDYSDQDGVYLKETDWIKWNELGNISGEDEDLLDYYGLDKTGTDENGTLNIFKNSEHIIESKYIYDEETALKAATYKLGWNMNQHNILELTLPLKYSNLELGDTIAIDELIANELVFGEDYSLNNYLKTGLNYQRNDQNILPVFIINYISYTDKNIKIKCVQIHDWTGLGITGAEEFDDISEATITNSWTNNPEGTITAGPISDNRLGIRNKTEFILDLSDVLDESTPSYILNVNGNRTNVSPSYSFEQDTYGYHVFKFNNFGEQVVTIEVSNEIVATYQFLIIEPGDMDVNGFVNILDVVQIVGGITAGLENIILQDWFLHAGDIDNDGYVDILDVIILINNVLGDSNV